MNICSEYLGKIVEYRIIYHQRVIRDANIILIETKTNIRDDVGRKDGRSDDDQDDDQEATKTTTKKRPRRDQDAT